MNSFVVGAYLVCSVLFILSLSGLSHQKSSKSGLLYGVIAMFLAILSTFFISSFNSNFTTFLIFFLVGGIIGTIIALRVEMINMPQMVAALHSFVGLSATLVSFSHFLLNPEQSVLEIIETSLGVFIGAITFTGSIVAYGKLNGDIRGDPLILCGWGRHVLNLVCILTCVALGVVFGVVDDLLTQALVLLASAVVAGFIGWHLVMAIGGADMPVVVSMLNSYSGWATSASGFLLENQLLIITGALVGSSGAILSYIMCKAMNRSFFSVIAGGFGQSAAAAAPQDQIEGKTLEINLQGLVHQLQNANKIVIVPGYGMAAAKCQYNIAVLTTLLQKKGKKVLFCIHPVAGRLPGHMNVLLAEADVDYNIVKEMDELNEDFKNVDVVLVIGANDIVNPDALENPSSVIAGMPVCRVWESKKVVVFKRGKGTGYAGIENPLFFKPNTNMFYGDAAKSVQSILNTITEMGENFSQSNSGFSLDDETADTSTEIEVFMDPIMTIGVPKETYPLEKRVAVTPACIKKMRKLGFRVLIEQNAGKNATFLDEAYRQQGAQIVTKEEVWQAEVILKVRKPSEEETEFINADTLCIISFVYPSSHLAWLESLAKSHKTLSYMAMDCVPRTTKAQKLDSLSSMANIGGYRAVMEAFQYFQKCPKPMMTAAGKLPPAQVLIMGAGVAGLSAIGYCKSLGCVVKAIDSRSAARGDAESMGAQFLEVSIKEDGSTAAGYAKEMSEEYKKAQAEMIRNAARNADIIITTALIPGRPAPLLIPTDVVLEMKPGSVIVDMAAEMGGNCELTKKDSVFVTENEVTIIGFTDLVSRMAPQSSELYSNNLYHLIDYLGGAENFKVSLSDEIIKTMTVIHSGSLTYSVSRPLPSVSSQPQKQILQETPESAQAKIQLTCLQKYDFMFIAGFLILSFISLSLVTYTEFMSLVMTFVLAVFIGFMVIWNVSAALHTPLMSVTNAISGIIVIGAMLCLEPESGVVDFGSVLGMLSVFFASINIWGGFIVTYRMLSMFKTNLDEKGSKH